MTAETDLLPCPFCGAVEPIVAEHPNAIPPMFRVICSGVVCRAVVEGRTLVRAKLMWNRRACVSSATEALRAERDAAFRMSRCECASDECCANLVKHQPASGRVREALEAAARSLRTIADQAGKTEGLDDMMNVRGYANSRANVAEAALSSTSTGVDREGLRGLAEKWRESAKSAANGPMFDGASEYAVAGTFSHCADELLALIDEKQES